jgi:PAS domain S-box-containing protein
MKQPPVTILLIDDDRSTYLSVRAMLASTRIETTLEWKASYGDGLSALIENRHHIALVDYYLGDGSGTDLLREARDTGCNVPMVMLTGRSDRELDLEALTAGAADFLVKGQFDTALLERTIRYVLERRRSAEALRRSEEYFRLLIENSSDIIMVLESDGVIRFSSPSLQRVLGYIPEDILGRSGFQLIYPEDRPKLLAAFNDLMGDQGNVRSVVFRIRHRDGSWHYLESVGRNLMNEPLVQGIIVSSRDVTERIQFEVALKESKEQLEIRVQERTAELNAAMEKLEEAHLMQKRFVADASHDLRTPLTVINGEIDLLLRGNRISDETRLPLERVIEELKRLESLASDLLMLARLDANIADRTDVVRLDELLLDCVEKLTMLARQKDIRWGVRLSDPVEINCDAYALDRAISNVLENAIKYSPRQSLVDVMLESDNEHYAITIADNGPGIPASDLPYVFDRFYRSDLTRSTPGTGLGLSIVKSVVEAHQGSVAVLSSPGEGTTVKIML